MISPTFILTIIVTNSFEAANKVKNAIKFVNSKKKNCTNVFMFLCCFKKKILPVL